MVLATNLADSFKMCAVPTTTASLDALFRFQKNTKNFVRGLFLTLHDIVGENSFLPGNEMRR